MGVKNGGYKQVCWKCKYSCDEDECIWVKTLSEYFDGTKLDEKGYIIFCPKFEYDGMIYDINDVCRKYGITRKKYNHIKIEICRRKFNMTVAEFLAFQKQKEYNRNIKKKLGETRYYYLMRKIKKYGLNISIEDYDKLLKKQSEEKSDPKYWLEYTKRKYREKIENQFKNDT